MVDLAQEVKTLRADNATLRTQLATERAAREALRVAHESMLVRLTTELAILQRRVFGQKAERLRNDGAQQSFMDILKELGLFEVDPFWWTVGLRSLVLSSVRFFERVG